MDYKQHIKDKITGHETTEYMRTGMIIFIHHKW